MDYRIHIRRVAHKQLDQLDDNEFKAIVRVISNLEKNPRPPKVKKLAGSDFWRVRIGLYRIVYAIDDLNRIITILKVAKRYESTYRGL